MDITILLMGRFATFAAMINSNVCAYNVCVHTRADGKEGEDDARDGVAEKPDRRGKLLTLTPKKTKTGKALGPPGLLSI